MPAFARLARTGDSRGESVDLLDTGSSANGAILSSSYELVDPYTLEITQTTRTSGKVTSVNTVTRTVSRDRKTLTLKTNGSKFATVWDRQ